MAAELISENASENVKAGFVELGVVQVWQTITSARSDPFTVALGAAGLPAIQQSSTFGGQTLYVISRTPSRVDDDATGRKWHITVTWSNRTESFDRNKDGEPVNTPTQAVKDVDIQYLEYSEPITDAKFLNVTIGGGAGGSGTVLAPGTGNNDYRNWLKDGAVLVSTGESVLATRNQYREIITVSRNEASWNSNYADYTNTVNNASLTITEQDSSGTKATYTYPAKTLKMKPITKQPVWKDGVLYFRVSFSMEYNELTWIHSEVDASQSERVYVDQLKPGGGAYTQADIDKMNPEATAGSVKFGIVPITFLNLDGDTVAVGDRRLLDGRGGRLGNAETSNTQGKSHYTNWEIFEEKDWSSLNL
ncbi:MAG: hypothetical protein GY818_01350 [Planctomycetaceae bacterium]|nr:hypothetical protein [Planctomycetaceae bacterium]